MISATTWSNLSSTAWARMGGESVLGWENNSFKSLDTRTGIVWEHQGSGHERGKWGVTTWMTLGSASHSPPPNNPTQGNRQSQITFLLPLSSHDILVADTLLILCDAFAAAVRSRVCPTTHTRDQTALFSLFLAMKYKFQLTSLPHRQSPACLHNGNLV